MNLHVVKSRKQPKNGKSYEFYILRRNVYLPESQSTKPQYLAYIGKSSEISVERADEIAKRASERTGEPISVHDLSQVKGISIVNNDTAG